LATAENADAQSRDVFQVHWIRSRITQAQRVDLQCGGSAEHH